MQLNNLTDLYVAELRDLYDAERQLVDALPKMATAAKDNKLREGFEHHLEQTREHVRRLERIFSELGEAPGGETCHAMKGLIKEGEEIMNITTSDADVKDAALITAAQRVEHYEIAGYGGVRTFAEKLGHKDQAKLLQETLDEEGDTDKKLTKLATGGMLGSGINQDAKE